MFTSPMGTPMRHSNFYRRVWLPAVAKAGLSGDPLSRPAAYRKHPTADAGANLRELMDRMGHSSTRAALIYLHSSDERQRMLADAVGKTARSGTPQSRRSQEGIWHGSGTPTAGQSMKANRRSEHIPAELDF